MTTTPESLSPPTRPFGAPGLLLSGAALFALGALAMLGVLYNRPGSRVVEKLALLTGLKDQVTNEKLEWFAHGKTELILADRWTRVRAPGSSLWHVRPGLDVQRVANGFTYPVNIAFAQDPSSEPDAPFFYVNELHGDVKYVDRTGKVHHYATGLINFKPTPSDKSDEAGLSGLTTVPGSEDLLVTGTYLHHESGLLRNRILRLVSAPGGRSMQRMDVLLDLPEFTSPSNMIQQAQFGPDGKLYVSVGDGENEQLPMDLTKFGGKILRLNLDGTACADNPFYDATTPDSPRGYVFAYGLRNVFDIDFEPVTGALYGVDNGKKTDRLTHIIRGATYGWNGREGTGRMNALFCWTNPTVAPVGLVILRNDALGTGSRGKLYVGTYGPPGAPGPNFAKKIVEFELDAHRGMITDAPRPILEYAGQNKTTVLGLAEGPDGLYFTDFFGEAKPKDRHAAGTGAVWKVVPSEHSLSLPTVTDPRLANLPSRVRGQVSFARNCITCHSVGDTGGKAGPDLTDVGKRLDRVNSRAYEAQVRILLASPKDFVRQQHGRLKEVLAASGEQRKRVWLKHHIEQPKFDDLFATMPSFSQLPAREREDLIDFLLLGGE